MKVLVAYDGTLQAKDALRYGLDKVRENGGEVVALHVFDRGMFVDYDAIPGVEEMARKDAERHVDEARSLIRESGVRARVITEDGSPEEEVLNYAMARNVDILLCPPKYKSIINGFKKMAAERGIVISEDSVLDNGSKLKVAVAGRTA